MCTYSTRSTYSVHNIAFAPNIVVRGNGAKLHEPQSQERRWLEPWQKSLAGSTREGFPYPNRYDNSGPSTATDPRLFGSQPDMRQLDP